MLKMYTDASTKNSFGPSGVGIVISGESIYEQLAIPLEQELSNHEAEFEAVIQGLTSLINKKWTNQTILIYTDSKIVVSAIEKKYVKNAGFADYLTRIQKLLASFDLYFIHWIPDAQNKGADHLARQALAKRLKQL